MKSFRAYLREVTDPKKLEKIGVAARIRAHGPDRKWPKERGPQGWKVRVQFKRSDFESKMVDDFKVKAKKAGIRSVGKHPRTRELAMAVDTPTQEEAAKKVDEIVNQTVALWRKRQIAGKT